MKRSTIIKLILAITLLIFGYIVYKYYFLPPATNIQSTTVSQNTNQKNSVNLIPPQLTTDLLKDLTYQLPDTIKNIQLTNGVYDATPPNYPKNKNDYYYVLAEKLITFGNLDNDTAKDAVVILESRAGGTGNFSHLAIVINKNGTPLNVASIYLGDRVEILSISIKSKIISVNMITQGENDPLCCPTLKKTLQYKLSGNDLIKL